MSHMKRAHRVHWGTLVLEGFLLAGFAIMGYDLFPEDRRSFFTWLAVGIAVGIVVGAMWLLLSGGSASSKAKNVVGLAAWGGAAGIVLLTLEAMVLWGILGFIIGFALVGTLFGPPAND